MKRLILISYLILIIGCSNSNRELKTVNFSGSGYELGVEHGSELKREIANVLEAWKKNVKNQLDKDANIVIDEFFEYASFDESIKKWTPHCMKR